MSLKVKTVLKILLACLLVGMVLSWIDFNAIDVFRSMGQAMHYSVDWVRTNVGQVIEWILLGAIVVLPIVLIRFGVKRLKGRRPAAKGKQSR
ncbi:MAG: hypothetical protein QF893_17050 [Alphaproteobacteria bacterium]|jgi:hypothetical protein|nr:hypothetical protein [Alphaproteobacteria bacterium]